MEVCHIALFLCLSALSCLSERASDASYGPSQSIAFADERAQYESPQEVSRIPGMNEYPIVLPKRTALFLDRIMLALRKAVEDDDSINTKRQRKFIKDNKTYWRCYFNAVSCF